MPYKRLKLPNLLTDVFAHKHGHISTDIFVWHALNRLVVYTLHSDIHNIYNIF